MDQFSRVFRKQALEYIVLSKNSISVSSGPVQLSRGSPSAFGINEEHTAVGIFGWPGRGIVMSPHI